MQVSKYDRVSKTLHWSMAILFLVQFASSLAHYFLEDSAIEALLWPTHKPVGFLLFGLVLVRIVWTVITSNKRPKAVSSIAKTGHMVLYACMVLVPLAALLRQYGSGRSFEVFGVTIFSGFETEKIGWMLDIGNVLHGELGWVFLALVIGHIAMIFVHKSKGENILERMK